MKLTDGRLVLLWTERSGQWHRTLAALHRHHERNLGRAPGPIHWIGSPDAGPWTWFGFFWEPEKFWFGYGLQDGDWRPLIEADTRQPAARAWRHLAEQLPEVWPVAGAGSYRRLWAPPEIGALARAHERWFRDRSQELNDYALGNRAN